MRAKLSRADYEELAEMVRNLPADPTREAVALALANVLTGTNPQYDRSRFFAAATRAQDGTRLTNGSYYPQG